jgi:hypothetical protein
MIYRKLGSTGERFRPSALAATTMGVPKDAAEGMRIVRSAVDRRLQR